MALTWGGYEIAEYYGRLIYQLTGAWPKTTGMVNGSGSFTSTSVYTTELEVTSGPYILVAVAADPDANTDEIDVKVTVDGTLIANETALSPTGDNYIIGQMFDDQGAKDHMPVLARTSIKIEAKLSGTSTGTQYVRWVYMPYSLS